MRKVFGLLGTLSIILLSSASCKKSVHNDLQVTASADSAQSVRPGITSVYTVDSTGTPAPGVILAAPFDLGPLPTAESNGLLLIMDEHGKVLRQKVTPGKALDFKRWIINGQTRYTYMVNDPGALRISGLNELAGYAVIADSNLNEVRQVNFVPYGAGLFQAGQPLDIHDFILLSDSHYITLSYYAKYVNNIPARLNPAANVSVVTPIIEEVNNGAVVWSWDGSVDTAFYANSVESNNFSNADTTQDYIHMNSLFIDPRDGNLICSMRNQDQVIKINRQTGTVMWRLGGGNSDFPLLSNQVFLRQHHATLVDNNQTLLIFDDGQATQRPSSRIVEFQLDEANKIVNGFKSFDIPERFSTIMGSVQKMGDEYFIGGGSGDYILEVNYVTGQKIIELTSPLTTYRAFKYLN
ncbi:MAG: aryl-sulfate sulfotransferase [Chitinophagaceae bacterium]|nr:aryl-sulfate sulfotransferase [Chitinophagaceae bacterium]